MNVEDFVKIDKDEEDVNQMSPLVWAYVGDCVYELFVRCYLVNSTRHNVHKLHIEAIKYVKAGGQAEILSRIYDDLSDEEKDIVRRTRNCNNHHLPKNSNVQEYMHATAFEGLIGYLYLCKRFERVKEIVENSVFGK